MKRRVSARSGFFRRRASIALLVCAGVACWIISGTLLAFFRPEAPANSYQRTLSFAQRVAYQRAIEEVYWRHRIWEHPDPKPSLDAVISQAQLEKRVADYLGKSQALEDWQRPITAEQLQAEMDRMAQHTKQPEVLRELFEALGNDPVIIAECVARPALVARLMTKSYGHDQEVLGSERARAQYRVRNAMVATSGNYTRPRISDGSSGCVDNTWTATSTINAPAGRSGATSVWTGSEMIVWGGIEQSVVGLDTGGKYNPSTDSWTPTSTTNAPIGRYDHTAVWTGSEMIVWGGNHTSVIGMNTGGRYNPSTDSWTATSTNNAPSARYFHTAIWTGSEMIVWGGAGMPPPPRFNTGGRYNPDTDTWTATSTTNAPESRDIHTAVWTGGEMIVWGGNEFPSGATNTGGRYNPSMDSWTATSASNVPSARYFHTVVWTGSEMIIWGGSNGSNYLNTGGRYDPGMDSWTATNNLAPSARYSHTAVWAGGEMIVWGGSDTHSPDFDTGGRYNPGTDTWTSTSTINAPSGRVSHTAVWTGGEMIVWGGSDGHNYLNTGGRYCAHVATPTPTPTVTATVTPTITPSATATPTLTPSSTPMPTATATPTSTLTPRPRLTPTPRPRSTPVPRP